MTTASQLLAPMLLKLIETARVAAKRVIASYPATSRRATNPATQDDEAVHDLRVSVRRLRTLMRPARRVFGKRRLRRIGGELRAFAAATGALRDEEVLRETLQSLDLEGEAGASVRASLDGWLARRARTERSCRAEVVRMLKAAPARATPSAAAARRRAAARASLDQRGSGRRGRGSLDQRGSGRRGRGSLDRCLARLEKRLAHPKHKRYAAEELARNTLSAALADVRALAAGDPADGPAMHALRIRFKRLRYCAEAFSPLIHAGRDAAVAGSSLGERAARIARAASRMQRRLGQLHDVDEAAVRMRRARGLSPTQRAIVLDALATERARLVAKVSADLARELAALAAVWPAPNEGAAA